MQIILANNNHSYNVVAFFKDHLNCKNTGIYSQEFLCSDGVQAAIRRGQLMIAIENGEIIGAIRFYKKKTKNCISLYQFAIRKDFRGQGLFKQMLKPLNSSPIHVLCPIDSEFNEYYCKTGWLLTENDGQYNTWMIEESIM
ncbi:hypothetical protein J6TS2_35690 [Heyndrickxia sporothermodurans]|nr:hypothetical protein J6TS2_35690 [Heyndrickxia sporothermodurans]